MPSRVDGGGGPWILAVSWRMEVEVVEKVLNVWNDGRMSGRDCHGGKKRL